MNLKRQAFLAVFVIALVFLVMAGVIFQQVIHNLNDRAASRQVEKLGERWVSELDNATSQLKSVADLIAKDEMTHRYFRSTQDMEDVNLYPAYSNYVASVLEVFPEVGEISILFLDGTEDIRVAFGVENSSRKVASKVFREISNEGLDDIVGIEPNQDFETSVLTYYRALEVNSRINSNEGSIIQRVAYIRVLVPLERLFLSSKSRENAAYLPIVTDADGRLLYPGSLFSLTSYLISIPHSQWSGRHQIESKDWLFDIGAWRPDIHVVTVTDTHHDDWETRQSMTVMFSGALLLLILVPFLLAIILTRWVLNPLVSLVKAAKNTDYKVPDVELSRNDEIGILMRAFISMRGDLVQQNVQLKSLVYKDGLTGLPNRNALPHLLENCVDQKVEDFALLFLDLDGFKRVNDAYGHGQGDRLLQCVSQRILSQLRVNDSMVHYLSDNLPIDPSLVRLGGDEFTIILPNIDGGRNANEVAMRIIHSLKKPFKLDDVEVLVGASIGISLYPLHTKNLEELIKFSDFAMYEAKNRGKMQAVIFEPEFEQSESALLEIENAVEYAIEHDEVETWFQPKIDPKARQIKGFEALVRINSKKYGFLFPDKFIPIAERNHLIDSLTLIVVKSCCRLHKHIAVEYDMDLPMSINLSPIQIDRNDLFVDIGRVLENMSMRKEFLEFEVTETLIMQNEVAGRERLRDLRSQGYKTSLDDFGVGYSSLAYLKKFEFDMLKIDRSFFGDVHYDETSQAILKSIQNLANDLGMRVVAEGIETPDQLRLVVGYGIDLIQGYIFSKPLHERDILTYMRLFQRTTQQFDDSDTSD